MHLSETCNLLLPLMSACSTADFLELLPTFQLSIVLSNPPPPPPRLLEYAKSHMHSKFVKQKLVYLRQPLEKTECWTHFPPPQVEAGS